MSRCRRTRSRVILQIARGQSGMFGNTTKHAGAYLLPVMKSKSNIRPPGPFKNSVRTFLPLDVPTNPQESDQNSPRFNGAPFHGQINEKLAQESAPALLYRQVF